MRRRAINVVVFLLLLGGGAIVNVVVAWGCATCNAIEPDWSPHYNPYGEPLLIHLTRRFGCACVTGVGRSGTLLDRYPDVVKPYDGTPWWPTEAVSSLNRAYAISAGWPLQSLGAWRTTQHVSRPDHDYDNFNPVIHSGFVLDSERFGQQTAIDLSERVLPLSPLWPGFAINTIFYAAILWLVFAFPFVMRRRRRIKRGLCPACAYPVGTSPVCTECGKAVNSHEVVQ
jgi:hypothetical protein